MSESTIVALKKKETPEDTVVVKDDLNADSAGADATPEGSNDATPEGSNDATPEGSNDATPEGSNDANTGSTTEGATAAPTGTAIPDAVVIKNQDDLIVDPTKIYYIVVGNEVFEYDAVSNTNGAKVDDAVLAENLIATAATSAGGRRHSRRNGRRHSRRHSKKRQQKRQSKKQNGGKKRNSKRNQKK
jgi:hypothetical protein